MKSGVLAALLAECRAATSPNVPKTPRPAATVAATSALMLLAEQGASPAMLRRRLSVTPGSLVGGEVAASVTEVTVRNWPLFLGTPAARAGLLRVFEARSRDRGWRTLVSDLLPMLLPAAATLAFQPLVRVALAWRSDQVDEGIDALATWAAWLQGSINRADQAAPAPPRAVMPSAADVDELALMLVLRWLSRPVPDELGLLVALEAFNALQPAVTDVVTARADFLDAVHARLAPAPSLDPTGLETVRPEVLADDETMTVVPLEQLLDTPDELVGMHWALNCARARVPEPLFRALMAQWRSLTVHSEE